MRTSMRSMHAIRSRLEQRRMTGFRLSGILFTTWLATTIIGISPFASPQTLTELAVGSDSNPLRQLLLVLLFLLSMLAAGGWAESRRVAREIFPPTAVILFMLWCLISAEWSNEPATTLKRALMLWLVVLTSYAFVAVIGAQRALALLEKLLIAILLVNIMSILVSPYAVHVSGEAGDVVGDWKGMFSHKNGAGAITAITSIFLVDRLLVRRDLSSACLLLLSMFFLSKTDSKTSIILFFFSISLVAAYLRASSSPVGRRALRWFTMWVAISAAVLVAFVYDVILDAFGDASLFTGRMGLWNALFIEFLKHPLGGSGYGAFWSTGDDLPFQAQGQYGFLWFLDTTQGHNGFLDLLVSVGLPGLLLALWAFVVRGATDLNVLIHARSSYAFVCTAVFVFVFGNNLLESSLARGTHPTWIVFIVLLSAVFQLSRGTAGRIVWK